MRTLATACLLLAAAACAAPEPETGAEPSGSTAPTVDAGGPGPAPLPRTKVVLLGTGTPIPDPDRAGPATAVIRDGRAYLVDFGPGVVRRASAAALAGLPELDPRGLAVAFATHLHSDHTAGLPDLIHTPAVAGRRSPLRVFGPPGLAAMVAHVRAAWSEDLAVRGAGKSAEAMAPYDVEAVEVRPGPVLREGELEISAFAVRHGDWPHAYGYRFAAPDRTVVISGDTAPCDAVAEACDGCDVLVHEVYCHAGWAAGHPDWREYHAAYHTSAVELAAVAAAARPGVLVLTHVLHFGCTDEQLLREITDRWDGRVILPADGDVI
jgi:ribonuclease Z